MVYNPYLGLLEVTIVIIIRAFLVFKANFPVSETTKNSSRSVDA